MRDLVATLEMGSPCLFFLRSLSIKLMLKYTERADNEIAGPADMYRREKAINFTRDPSLVNIYKQSLF